MTVPDIDTDHLARIEIGEPITRDDTDADWFARAYHTDQSSRDKPFTPAAVDADPLPRKLNRDDTIDATAYDTDTLGAAVTPGDAEAQAEYTAEQDGLTFEDVYVTFLRRVLGASTAEVAVMADTDAAWVELTCETTVSIWEDMGYGDGAEDEATPRRESTKQ